MRTHNILHMLQIFVTKCFPHLDHIGLVYAFIYQRFSLPLFLFTLSVSKDPLRKCLFLPQLTLSLSDWHIELSGDEMPRQAKHTFNSNIAKIKLLCLPIWGPLCVCFGCLECWMGSLTWMLLGTCDSHIRPVGRAQWYLWDHSLWYHAGWMNAGQDEWRQYPPAWVALQGSGGFQ